MGLDSDRISEAHKRKIGDFMQVSSHQTIDSIYCQVLDDNDFDVSCVQGTGLGRPILLMGDGATTSVPESEHRICCAEFGKKHLFSVNHLYTVRQIGSGKYETNET